MVEHPALDPAKIVPVYVGSNELSPFHACYANERTVLRLAAGRFFAQDNGDDPEAGYRALRERAALFDVPERPVEISGPDAVAFLERVLTRRVADQPVGRGRYTLACAFDGGLFMDGILFRLAGDRFWFVQPDGDLTGWLLAHQAGFAVAVSDPRSRVLQLQGPRSFEIIEAASGGGIDRTLGYFHARFCRLDGQEVYVSRTGWTGELGYEIYTLGERTDCPAVWNRLIEAGKPHGLVFASMRAMNIRRIEAGILDAGSDFDTTMTPFEAGLDRFVDLGKDDFTGRGALLNARRGTRIYGLTCADRVPGGGDTVLDGTRPAGVVTTGAYSPHLACGIGYVRFDRPGDWSGRRLTLRTKDRGTAPIDIVDLPFYDRGKGLARGAGISD